MSQPVRSIVLPSRRLLAETCHAGRPHEVVEALSDAAQAWARRQAWGTAEAHLEEALRWAVFVGSVDALVELHCQAAEMAACSAEQGEPVERAAARRRARAHAVEAGRLADRVACPAWETVVLLRASDVLDRCGHRNDATELQARAVRQMIGSDR